MINVWLCVAWWSWRSVVQNLKSTTWRQGKQLFQKNQIEFVLHAKASWVAELPAEACYRCLRLDGLWRKWENFTQKKTIPAYKLPELKTAKAREGIHLPIIYLHPMLPLFRIGYLVIWSLLWLNTEYSFKSRKKSLSHVSELNTRDTETSIWLTLFFFFFFYL